MSQVLINQHRYDEHGTRIDNITDRALTQIKKHYQPSAGKKPQPITKEATFHCVYAVLPDRLYRETCAQNLKRQFPRIPLCGAATVSVATVRIVEAMRSAMR